MRNPQIVIPLIIGVTIVIAVIVTLIRRKNGK